MVQGNSKKDIHYSNAGFDEIVNEFGYFYTVFDLAKGDVTKYKAIYNQTVAEVYRTQQIKGRINKAEALYSRLKQGKL